MSEQILKPLSSPRKGWEKAFKEMRENRDDNLLIDDIFDDDEHEGLEPPQSQIIL